VSQPKLYISHIQYCTSVNGDAKASGALCIHYHSTISFAAPVITFRESAAKVCSTRIDFPAGGKTNLMFLNLSTGVERIDRVHATTVRTTASNIINKEKRGFNKSDAGNTFRMQAAGAGSTALIKGSKTNLVI
jgi:hypothetical protein